MIFGCHVLGRLPHRRESCLPRKNKAHWDWLPLCSWCHSNWVSSLHHLCSKLQNVDILTKALQPTQFHFLACKLGICDLHALTWGGVLARCFAILTNLGYACINCIRQLTVGFLTICNYLAQVGLHLNIFLLFVINKTRQNIKFSHWKLLVLNLVTYHRREQLFFEGKIGGNI